jgi:hypothetical protein
MKIASDKVKDFEDPSNGKLRYLRPFIVLLPTFIICVYDIYAKIDFMSSMIRLLLTILFFYFIGTIAQMIVRHVMIQASLDKETDEAILDIYSDDEEELNDEEEE